MILIGMGVLLGIIVSFLVVGALLRMKHEQDAELTWYMASYADYLARVEATKTDIEQLLKESE